MPISNDRRIPERVRTESHTHGRSAARRIALALCGLAASAVVATSAWADAPALPIEPDVPAIADNAKHKAEEALSDAGKRAGEAENLVLPPVSADGVTYGSAPYEVDQCGASSNSAHEASFVETGTTRYVEGDTCPTYLSVIGDGAAGTKINAGATGIWRWTAPGGAKFSKVTAYAALRDDTAGQ